MIDYPKYHGGRSLIATSPVIQAYLNYQRGFSKAITWNIGIIHEDHLNRNTFNPDVEESLVDFGIDNNQLKFGLNSEKSKQEFSVIYQKPEKEGGFYFLEGNQHFIDIEWKKGLKNKNSHVKVTYRNLFPPEGSSLDSNGEVGVQFQNNF